MKKKYISDYYLEFYILMLAGYALMGRGFAYIGIRPVYIGEIALIWGFVTVFFERNVNFFSSYPAKLLFLFIFSGIIHAVPYISIYGIDALRDSAIWIYACFAYIVYVLIVSKPERLILIMSRYKSFIKVFLILAPIFFWSSERYNLPHWPGAPVKIISIKQSDTLVHCTGILPFFMLLLIQFDIIWMIIFCLVSMYFAYNNRGSMLALFSSFMLLLFFYNFNIKSKRFVQLISAFFIIFIIFSFSQSSIIQHRFNRFSSIFTGTHEIEGTAAWRINWWTKIINYTFYGEYFWFGKGFGINLADDDGFQSVSSSQGPTLRSPHNIHMNILARTGVPGFILWISLQILWVLYILKNYRLSKYNKEVIWQKVFLFLLIYWNAFIINSTFDVVIEGPYGGIWFWTLFGLGLSACRIYKNNPDLFDFSSFS